MSEPKRVHFETNGVKKSTSDLSAAETPKTIRLELDLSTAELYPEFNYFDLVAAEKKKSKIPQLNGYGEIDPEDRRRALEFDRKYGAAYKGCGSNKRRMNTSLCDKGSGYDQSDPFIDDEIKYDENVPDEMEPDHGGFYINSGPLQFKKLANFERPEDAQRMPKPRKRAISSASSDSNASDDNESNAKNRKNGQPDKKAKLSNDKEKNVFVSKENAKSKGKHMEDGNTKKEVKTTTVKDMLRAKRDKNMRNTTDATNPNKPSGQTVTTTEDSSSSSDSSDSSDDDDEDNGKASDGNIDAAAKITEKITEKLPTGVVHTNELPGAISETNGVPTVEPVEVKLPENISENLRQKIKQMEELVKTTPKIFSNNEAQELFYEIDTVARSSNVQQTIYKYLAPHLGYSINTITSKAKILRVEKEEEKLRPLFDELQREINAVMPGALEQYELGCKKVNELKVAAAADKEADKPEQTFKNPRRKFPWNVVLRKTMEDIVALKRQSFKRIPIRIGKDYEYIETYFKEKLIPLWPPSWMRMDELRREFLKDANRKPKENKKPTDKTGIPPIKLPTTIAAKKPKSATTSVTSANHNNVKVHAIDLAAIEKATMKAPIVKTDKRLSDITSIMTGTSSMPAVISTASLTPTDMKSNSTTNPSNKTLKSNQDQRVINSSTAAISAKQSNTKSILDVPNSSIEIVSSPEQNSPSKKASDHSINHIISLPPCANNNKTITPTQYKNNTSNANNASHNNFDSTKSKSQPSKSTLNSNIVSNHGKVASPVFIHHVESPDKTVHVIKDSSSDDEVQIVDEKPKHVVFASSSIDSKANKHKRDKINAGISPAHAKPRLPKSILKATPDPLADDVDLRNCESTMNAIIELTPN